MGKRIKYGWMDLPAHKWEESDLWHELIINVELKGVPKDPLHEKRDSYYLLLFNGLQGIIHVVLRKIRALYFQKLI